MKAPARLICLKLDDVEAVSTSHAAGEKKVVSRGFEEPMKVKQIAVGRLKPGEIVEEHTHADMDECYYFMEGSGYIYLNGTQIALSKDMVINVAATVAHRIECTNAELKFYYFCLELVSESI